MNTSEQKQTKSYAQELLISTDDISIRLSELINRLNSVTSLICEEPHTDDEKCSSTDPIESGFLPELDNKYKIINKSLNEFENILTQLSKFIG